MTAHVIDHLIMLYSSNTPPILVLKVYGLQSKSQGADEIKAVSYNSKPLLVSVMLFLSMQCFPHHVCSWRLSEEAFMRPSFFHNPSIQEVCKILR